MLLLPIDRASWRPVLEIGGAGARMHAGGYAPTTYEGAYESKTHPKFRHIDGPVAVRVEKLQKVVLDGPFCAYNIGQPRFCEMVRVKVLRWGGRGGAGYEV